MTDEQFVLKEDIRTKKAMAISSKHKVVGSKTKKCRFPSDYLTKKEKEALNGEIKSWNMNEFYTYKEFKSMANDIQEQYLNCLIGKYNVSIGTISKLLFGLSDTALYNYAKDHKLKCNHCSTTGMGARKNAIAFTEAIQAVRDYDDLEKEEEPEVSVESVHEQILNSVKQNMFNASIDYAEFTFHGGIDYDALNTIVSKFTDSNVKIHIRIQKED